MPNLNAALLRQLLTYMAVGLLGTAAQYIILVAGVSLAGADPVIASSLGFTVGALVNYFANYHITFRSNKRHGRTLLQFVTVAAIGLGVNAAMMAGLTRGLQLQYILAQIAATGTVVLITFSANRLWTFREV